MADYIIIVLLVVGFIAFMLWQSNTTLKKRVEELEFQLRSKGVKFGQAWEQFVPMMRNFKYDPNKCHFIGKPIDYVIFDDNNIVFLEVKTGVSKLNENEIKLKQLVQDRKIIWEEVRV